ncbi:uncharacterized protein N7511_008038 [Penicillium nucicola]|uniref:uncharacterized protein n=1 Tax=Penicillium nucicola TaxID=1850975 RepID=UPI002545385D|nr:uncharacterized protein N7511_008038 [Penicillium nucicola]KAJ5753885.1 hypothetical protein N7511_008038 [Penicillium nucicola]
MLAESEYLIAQQSIQDAYQKHEDQKHKIQKQEKQRFCSGEHILLSLQLLLLLVPLTLSILLLYGDIAAWLLPGTLYNMVNKWRSSVQTAVQVISAALAAIEVFALCRLINLATRIFFTKAPMSLDMLGFWSAISTPTVNWSHPVWMIIITFLFSNLHTSFSAVWAGALTPVDTLGVHNTTVQIPDWSNITLIKEYPSQIDSSGPSIRNTKGYFTYSVGMGLLGSLLASANSASTVDGSIRNHNKLDNTRYNYHGRSYGAGASAGLNDQSVLSIPHAVNYTYTEVALASSVSCIYNSSSDFGLQSQSDTNAYPATGYLPDSTSGEYSTYIGYGKSAIVAIGVAAQPISWTTPTRYMAIAAGDAYENLNQVQCAVSFSPTRFNVSVDVTNRRITVQKSLSETAKIPNIDPRGNLTHVLMRQLELISNDQTSFYRSTVGDAFNASISDYRTSLKTNETTNRTSEFQITMKGVENAVISYIDDMLVAYASAQLQVGGFTTSTPTVVHVDALRIGSRGYIIASACITLAIILLVVAEAIRMRGWRALPAFDYLDTPILVIRASKGVRGTTQSAQNGGHKPLDRVLVVWKGEALDDVGLISVGTPRKGSKRLLSG